METMKCEKCGADLESVERFRIRPSWAGGGREAYLDVMPCEACERHERSALEVIQQERQIKARLRDSGIDERVWNLGLDSDTMLRHGLDIDNGNRNAVEHLREWVQAESAGCALEGTQGLGKTLLALCAGVDCIRHGQEVLFVTEREIIDSFRERTPSTRDVKMLARSVEVLILDDIGRHQIDRGGKYMVEVYLDLFDVRLGVFGPPMKTLITTQHDPASLARACADDALASRLMAIIGGNHIELTGKDRRRVRWNGGKAGAK